MPRRPPIPPGVTPERRRGRKSKREAEAASATHPPLRALYRSVAQGDEERRLVVQELKSSGDRTACIILSAMIERNLEAIILLKMGFTSAIDMQTQALLFNPGCALSSFNGNIRLGGALGLIDKLLMDDLDFIRRLRNIFAHSAVPITFQTPEIRHELSKMRELDNIDIYNLTDLPSLERKNFTAVCFSALDRIQTKGITCQCGLER